MQNLRPAIDQFSDDFLEWAHPSRAAAFTVHLPLMALREAIGCVLCYWIFILFGKMMMKHSKPMEFLKPIQILYNIAQVVLCTYMFTKTIETAFFERYSIVCNGTKHYSNPKLMAFLTWLFYVSKAFDFLDTVWIVLRKKWDQLTFLHVYHHSTIFLIYWMNARVCFAGDIYLTIVLNSFVHMVMYLYYFLCAIGHRPRWKKFVTQVQLLQFVLMIVQASVMLGTGCAHPAENVIRIFLAYIASLLFLFLKFYSKSYTAKKLEEKKD